MKQQSVRRSNPIRSNRRSTGGEGKRALKELTEVKEVKEPQIPKYPKINKRSKRLKGKKRKVLLKSRAASLRKTFKRKHASQRTGKQGKRAGPLHRRRGQLKKGLRRRSRHSNVPQAKMILVLDHFVPHYDKDTGSRTMYQYLRMFADMGLRVKFAGFDFTRYEPYTSELEQSGIQVISGQPDELNRWLDRHGRSVAYAYINRPHVGELYLDAVRARTSAKIIYNSVDFGFLREERRAIVEQNPLAMAHAEELKRQEFALFGKSDVVYTVSEYERALLEAELPGKRVVDIPIFFYNPPFPLGQPYPLEGRNLITFVGGFNHSPNVDGVLWFVSDIWPAIRRELPEAVFAVIGSNPPPSITELDGNGIWVTGYVSDEELEWLYSRTRVVVAPLRYGAGVKGKVIEAAAYALPVVTTSIGVEGIKEPGDIIAVDDSNEGFAAQVTDLYRNSERWQFVRDRQTEYASRCLTTDYAKQVLSEDIVP